jgi:hypothetical protein
MGTMVPDALTPAHTVVTVGATSTTVLAANAARQYANPDNGGVVRE